MRVAFSQTLFEHLCTNCNLGHRSCKTSALHQLGHLAIHARGFLTNTFRAPLYKLQFGASELQNVGASPVGTLGYTCAWLSHKHFSSTSVQIAIWGIGAAKRRRFTSWDTWLYMRVAFSQTLFEHLCTNCNLGHR